MMAGRWVGEGENVSEGGLRVLGSMDDILGQTMVVGIIAGIVG